LVYISLGPDLLESAYEAALNLELKKEGLKVRLEIPLPLMYEGVARRSDTGLICWLKTK
jgi:GxxExxY protein